VCGADSAARAVNGAVPCLGGRSALRDHCSSCPEDHQDKEQIGDVAGGAAVPIEDGSSR
jgi:hypothetical protein